MHLKQDHRLNNVRYVVQVPLLGVYTHLEDNRIAENLVRLFTAGACMQTNLSQDLVTNQTISDVRSCVYKWNCGVCMYNPESEEITGNSVRLVMTRYNQLVRTHLQRDPLVENTPV